MKGRIIMLTILMMGAVLVSMLIWNIHFYSVSPLIKLCFEDYQLDAKIKMIWEMIIVQASLIAFVLTVPSHGRFFRIDTSFIGTIMIGGIIYGTVQLLAREKLHAEESFMEVIHGKYGNCYQNLYFVLISVHLFASQYLMSLGMQILSAVIIGNKEAFLADVGVIVFGTQKFSANDREAISGIFNELYFLVFILVLTIASGVESEYVLTEFCLICGFIWKVCRENTPEALESLVFNARAFISEIMYADFGYYFTGSSISGTLGAIGNAQITKLYSFVSDPYGNGMIHYAIWMAVFTLVACIIVFVILPCCQYCCARRKKYQIDGAGHVEMQIHDLPFTLKSAKLNITANDSSDPVLVNPDLSHKVTATETLSYHLDNYCSLTIYAKRTCEGLNDELTFYYVPIVVKIVNSWIDRLDVLRSHFKYEILTVGTQIFHGDRFLKPFHRDLLEEVEIKSTIDNIDFPFVSSITKGWFIVLPRVYFDQQSQMFFVGDIPLLLFGSHITTRGTARIANPFTPCALVTNGNHMIARWDICTQLNHKSRFFIDPRDHTVVETTTHEPLVAFGYPSDTTKCPLMCDHDFVWANVTGESLPSVQVFVGKGDPIKINESKIDSNILANIKHSLNK